MNDDPLLRGVPQVQGHPLLAPCLLYESIGSGGMGAVYLAHHLRLGIDVAVKCMRPERATRDESWVVRFQREASMAARVSHQNLVRAYDVSRWQDIHYLVMDYVHGENARERVQRLGALPIAQALAIVRDAAAGLAAAHRAGIVHRDIKPDNILISLSGEVKVADLGLAKAVDTGLADVQATMQTMAMGTPLYMSPEQWDDARTVGPQTDVYALGATLYFLVAGRDGRKGGSFTDMMRRVIYEPYPSLREALPDAPDDLNAFIERATERFPERRFADAGEFAEALQHIAHDEPLGIPRGTVVPARQMPRTRPTAAIIQEALLAISAGHEGGAGSAEAPTAVATTPVPAESVAIDCPACGSTLRVRASGAARKGRCPRCGHQITVQLGTARSSVSDSNAGLASTVVSVSTPEAPTQAVRSRGQTQGGAAHGAGRGRGRRRSRGAAAAVVAVLLAAVAVAAAMLSSPDVADVSTRGLDTAALEKALAACDVDEARRIVRLADGGAATAASARIDSLDAELKTLRARIAELRKASSPEDLKRLLTQSETWPTPLCAAPERDAAVGEAYARFDRLCESGVQQALDDCDEKTARSILATWESQGSNAAAIPFQGRLQKMESDAREVASRAGSIESLRDPTLLARAIQALEQDYGSVTCLADRVRDIANAGRTRIEAARTFQAAWDELALDAAPAYKAEQALSLLVRLETLDATRPPDVDLVDSGDSLRRDLAAIIERAVSGEVLARSGGAPATAERWEPGALLLTVDQHAAEVLDSPSQTTFEDWVRRLLTASGAVIETTPDIEGVAVMLTELDGFVAQRSEPSFPAVVQRRSTEIAAALGTAAETEAGTTLADSRRAVQHLTRIRQSLETETARHVIDAAVGQVLERVASSAPTDDELNSLQTWIAEVRAWIDELEFGSHTKSSLESSLSRAAERLSHAVESEIEKAHAKLMEAEIHPDRAIIHLSRAESFYRNALRACERESPQGLVARVGLAEVEFRRIHNESLENAIGKLKDCIRELEAVADAKVRAVRSDGSLVNAWAAFIALEAHCILARRSEYRGHGDRLPLARAAMKRLQQFGDENLIRQAETFRHKYQLDL